MIFANAKQHNEYNYTPDVLKFWDMRRDEKVEIISMKMVGFCERI